MVASGHVSARTWIVGQNYRSGAVSRCIPIRCPTGAKTAGLSIVYHTGAVIAGRQAAKTESISQRLFLNYSSQVEGGGTDSNIGCYCAEISCVHSVWSLL